MRRAGLGFVVTLLLAVTTVSAQDRLAAIPSPEGSGHDGASTVVLFFSDTCPHCHNEIRWIGRIQSDFPEIEFVQYEVDEREIRANQEYFAAVMDAFDSQPIGWPRTVIGDRVFIGFVPRDGELVFNEEYAGWIGYQNQLYQAIADLATD